MENNTLCNRHSLGVNNHTKMYVTYTRIYGWSDYGGESSYQPGYRLENMMWMTLLVYDYIIPGEKSIILNSFKLFRTICRSTSIFRNSYFNFMYCRLDDICKNWSGITYNRLIIIVLPFRNCVSEWKACVILYFGCINLHPSNSKSGSVYCCSKSI